MVNNMVSTLDNQLPAFSDFIHQKRESNIF